MYLIMKYFTLEEMYKSQTAVRMGIQNMPNEAERASVEWNLQYLIGTVLDPLRKFMNTPILVTSGYRCKELNAKVGGVQNSQHMKGEAADITINGAKCTDLLQMAGFIECYCDYDQLIVYRPQKFIHVSTKMVGNRHELIIK